VRFSQTGMKPNYLEPEATARRGTSMEWLLKWSTSGWPVTAGSKRTPNRRRKLDAFPDSSASNDDAPDERMSLDDFVRSPMME
jgi:hypothetical protein